MQRIAWLTIALAVGCGSPEPATLAPEGELADPPFAVRGEGEGLLLVWFDHEGLHTAGRRSEIPGDRRALVRVDDLGLAPEQRLDPDYVYVADLREPGGGGEYTVRRMVRSSFEARVDAATRSGGGPEGRDPPIAAAPPGDDDPSAPSGVVIYGASWCSACRSAAAYLRQRNVPFVERDIERDPGARDAMMRTAQRAGVSARGIPLIDFRGRVLTGFDPDELGRMIDQAPI